MLCYIVLLIVPNFYDKRLTKKCFLFLFLFNVGNWGCRSWFQHRQWAWCNQFWSDSSTNWMSPPWAGYGWQGHYWCYRTIWVLRLRHLLSCFKLCTKSCPLHATYFVFERFNQFETNAFFYFICCDLIPSW